MADLKRCPFCGGEASLLTKSSIARNPIRGWEFGIVCERCAVSTPKTDYRLEVQLGHKGQITTLTDEREMAIEAWNRRVSENEN